MLYLQYILMLGLTTHLTQKGAFIGWLQGAIFCVLFLLQLNEELGFVIILESHPFCPPTKYPFFA